MDSTFVTSERYDWLLPRGLLIFTGTYDLSLRLDHHGGRFKFQACSLKSELNLSSQRNQNLKFYCLHRISLEGDIWKPMIRSLRVESCLGPSSIDANRHI
jgi:hypothetical protein